jgi:hypothetical protein
VLIDGSNLWKLHGRWLLGTLVAALAAIGWTVFAAKQNGRWPGGGSFSGLTLGMLAAFIFLSELALVVKKSRPFRTVRWLGSAQIWMKAHIWLGLLTVPLVILHSGGRIGGTLTTVFVLVFTIVIASGVWGLMLQNLLPRLLLEAAPAETVYSQIDRVGRQYAEEARRLVFLACGEAVAGNDSHDRSSKERRIPLRGVDPSHPAELAVAAVAPAACGHIAGAPRRVGVQVNRSPNPAGAMAQPVPSPPIQNAVARDIEPFLETGMSESGLLGPRQRNQWYFDDLRLRVVPELRALVGQLEELCERRRQLNLQKRIHFWLHNWLWVHLPLSIALMILLVGHIVFALRFG